MARSRKVEISAFQIFVLTDLSREREREREREKTRKERGRERGKTSTDRQTDRQTDREKVKFRESLRNILLLFHRYPNCFIFFKTR